MNSKKTLEEIAKKNHDKMLVETVFRSLAESQEPKENLAIEAFVKGQVTELTIYGKKYKVVTDTFIESITKQIELTIEKSKKDNIMIESRVKNLEKYVSASAMITERLEKTNSSLIMQNRQLEKQIQRLKRDVNQIRILDE